MEFKKIILSRTDGIGDVLLTLPLAGIIKSMFPDCAIIFLGRKYTREIVTLSKSIDRFIAFEELETLDTKAKVAFMKELNADAIIHVFPKKEIASLAKKAGIPLRIGTSHRSFHWLTCNKKISFTRRNSDLHEAQLNTKLLAGIGIDKNFELSELLTYYGLETTPSLSDSFKAILLNEKFNLIFHPKSKGSAREWGLNNYNQLLKILPEEKFRVFITGTEEEGKIIRKEMQFSNNIIDLTGKMNLSELTGFIAHSDGLLACSTGPLHIAAAFNKFALGIYAPMHPIHPGRWAPLGKNAGYIVKSGDCSKCRKSKMCECIVNIAPSEVLKKLIYFYNQKFL